MGKGWEVGEGAYMPVSPEHIVLVKDKGVAKRSKRFLNLSI